jgi:cyclase
MNRSHVPLVCVTFATLAITSIAMYGQSPSVDARALKATQLAANFYTLQGGGCAIGALIGPDGVLLVDSGSAGHEDNIIAAIREISNAPIRFVINTNARMDYTGGNETFAKLGATILGRPQLRERLAHPIFSANGMRVSTPPPAPEIALPVVTYDAPTTLYMNGEQIELIPIPRSYSDGDSVVRFVRANVIMTGELYHSVSYPNIDRANGGTLQGLLDGLSAVVAMAGPRTRIVPGHDESADRNAVAAQRDMILVLRDRVLAMIRQGKSEKEVIAAELNADYPSKRLGPNRFMRSVYEELDAAK